MTDTELTGLEPLLARLVVLATRSRQTEQPMRDAAALTLRSVRRNFDVGGRPPWERLKTSTLRNKKGGRILVRTGKLRRSFTADVSNSRTQIDNTASYGIFPQTGTRKMARRSFMLFQDEDVAGIRGIFRRHWFQ